MFKITKWLLIGLVLMPMVSFSMEDSLDLSDVFVEAAQRSARSNPFEDGSESPTLSSSDRRSAGASGTNFSSNNSYGALPIARPVSGRPVNESTPITATSASSARKKDETPWYIRYLPHIAGLTTAAAVGTFVYKSFSSSPESYDVISGSRMRQTSIMAVAGLCVGAAAGMNGRKVYEKSSPFERTRKALCVAACVAATPLVLGTACAAAAGGISYACNAAHPYDNARTALGLGLIGGMYWGR